jgi:hypothetical protein
MIRNTWLHQLQDSRVASDHISMVLAVVLAQAVDARECAGTHSARVRLDASVLRRVCHKPLCARKGAVATITAKSRGKARCQTAKADERVACYDL